MRKKIIRIISLILFSFVLFIYLTSLYINHKFYKVPFEQLLYTIKYSKGANKDVIYDGIKYIAPRFIIVCLVVYIVQLILKKFILSSEKRLQLNIKIGKKTFKFNIFDFSFVKRLMLYLIAVGFFSYCTLDQLGLGKFIKQQFQTTKIYENYYVNPKDVKITFPEKKRNLIYIVLESEEMTNASKANGGGLDVSLIPNLENLALKNTSFSNTDKLGGALNLVGTGYTAASLVGQTSGTPLSLKMDGNSYHGYSQSYPGLYTLGEVLEKNGYKNYFMLGSDADFGGRSDYFEQHGNYKIMDYNYAKSKNWIENDYNVWWGYEDKKLFEFAKKELKQISKNNEPFNFTILTADTHFIDGYYDHSCPTGKFETQYENVFNCNDQMIYDFITWIQKQDFYKNTTIVISGDHLTMQGNFYDSKISKNYERTVYNAIMNSAINNTNNKLNRNFSVLDLYPTTLAALGATIEGNVLGFGTNLYSGVPTIIEKLGFEYVDSELCKKSDYYDNLILGETYYEIEENS